MEGREVSSKTLDQDHLKILVVCQHYWPEPFRFNDFCEELVKRGHEVHVLTGFPNYPEGALYKGYEHGEHKEETYNGVQIHRCKIMPRKSGVVNRVLNYYSYALSSSFQIILNRIKPDYGGDFDVILCNQTSPVFMAEAAIKYKKLKNKKLVLYCYDLWPESLLAGGIKEGSPIYNYFHRVSRQIYREADKILVTSRAFKDYISAHFKIDENRIEYLPQYGEAVFDEKPVGKTGSEENIHLVFAGNIGEVQDIQTIAKAAELLKDEEKIQFHIIGTGSYKEHIEQYVMDKHLNNMNFYGRIPIQELIEYYINASAMLITLRDIHVLGYTVPGKLQSYMAAGKPVIGAINGESQKIIREAECGLVVNSGDAEGLAEAIRKFASLSYSERESLGKKARAYYDANFSKDRFMNRLEEILREYSK